MMVYSCSLQSRTDLPIRTYSKPTVVGVSLEEAVGRALDKMLKKVGGAGGLIALDRYVHAGLTQR